MMNQSFLQFNYMYISLRTDCVAVVFVFKLTYFIKGFGETIKQPRNQLYRSYVSLIQLNNFNVIRSLVIW